MSTERRPQAQSLKCWVSRASTEALRAPTVGRVGMTLTLDWDLRNHPVQYLKEGWGVDRASSV